MEFAFSAEQQQLADMVADLLSKKADSESVRAAMTSESGYDDALWQLMCEQIGVAALAVPEEYEGAGFSLFETLVVLEQIGASLAPSPLLATLMATEALLAAGTDEAKSRLLPRIAAGETATIVLADAPALDADRAAIVLGVVGEDLVEVQSDEVFAWRESMDQTVRLAEGLSEVDLASATMTVVGDGGAAAARARLVGTVGVTALQAGLARRALDMTVQYSKERVQFGRPIGSFQALKHRMADMLVLVEMTRSGFMAAADAVTRGTAEAEELVATAKAYAGDALAHIAGETVQLHGGIAITWEHDAHLVFKRAHALDQLFGSAHVHRASLAL